MMKVEKINIYFIVDYLVHIIKGVPFELNRLFLFFAKAHNIMILLIT